MTINSLYKKELHQKNRNNNGTSSCHVAIFYYEKINVQRNFIATACMAERVHNSVLKGVFLTMEGIFESEFLRKQLNPLQFRPTV